MRFIKEFALVFTSLILQSQWRILSPFDLLAVMSFYFVLRFGWGPASLVAILGGGFWDALSGTPLGMKSMSLAVASFAVGSIHSFIFQARRIARLLMVGVGTMLALSLEGAIFALMGRMRGEALGLIFWGALANGALALLIYPVLDRVFRDPYECLAD